MVGAKSPNVGCIGADPKHVQRVGPLCFVDHIAEWLEILRFDHIFRAIMSIDHANIYFDGTEVS